MVLDHSGPALGMILYGAALKLFLLGAIIVRIVLPFGGADPWLGWICFCGGMLLLSVIIGVVESTMARLRLVQVPSLLIGACLLSAFGIVLQVR
jgi:formate hydrogenlyase subunit 4